jgi:hypothetical protein
VTAPAHIKRIEERDGGEWALYLDGRFVCYARSEAFGDVVLEQRIADLERATEDATEAFMAWHKGATRK